MKTLSLIETEKLRNFQESLRALYEISEKYDELREKCDREESLKCASCKISSNSEENSTGQGHREAQKTEPLITALKATETNSLNEQKMDDLIESRNSELLPNPGNSQHSDLEWYRVL